MQDVPKFTNSRGRLSLTDSGVQKVIAQPCIDRGVGIVLHRIAYHNKV